MAIEFRLYHSNVTKADCEKVNDLFDLLEIEPAKPVPQSYHENRTGTLEFTPNYDKHYIPRKGSKSKLKVQTVGDIRSLFERDVYSYLSNDLEKQRHSLLRKIQDGFSNDDKTKNFAKCLLKADDNPISRSAWQMLSTINPEGHNHPKQFVLWNGKCIQVNGSRGGKSKFICNYDLKNKAVQVKNRIKFNKNMFKSRIRLLRNSLNVKFKPGPLGKKKFLVDSHHKYQMNHIELINLPTPALQVLPAYGTILEPTISSFISNALGEAGVISEKMAEFAVSVLGTIRDKTPVQLEKDCCISFDLNYHCNQSRLLVRRDILETTACIDGNDAITNINYSETIPANIEDNLKTDASTMSVIKQMMDEMLISTEISLNQDSVYSAEDESRETITNDCAEIIDTTKDKPKRKYLELDKLDVTVIKLPESTNNYTKTCNKSFCTLGCVCESLDCVFSLKQHCGVIDCMFGCKCEVSKYKDIELLDRDCSDIIPGLLNLNNEINSHLAKEEQKFHQTVIVSGEKSIVLNSRKRNCNSSTKNIEFCNSVKLNTDEKFKRVFTLDIKKLNCENIEPFCMVHNLYKCFCKGKFTESSTFNVPEINSTKTHTTLAQPITHKHSKLELEIATDKTTAALRRRLRPVRKSNDKRVSEINNDFVNLCDINESSYGSFSSTCTRTMGYTGRKYSDGYYRNTNNKIMEMEKNDHLLKKRMLRLINGANEEYLQSPDSSRTGSECVSGDEVSHISSLASVDVSAKALNKPGEISYPFPTVTGKSSLKEWLESSYKSYKERLGQGIIKNCLETPKKGKASLQSWDFILSRYRERKNIFFVSKQKPFHTFLVVNEKHPSFANCINIDDIRFADLHTYPNIIRNLVTNSTDSENSFCILRGWDHCWELIGSAVKVIEHVTEKQTEDTLETDKLMNQHSFAYIDDNDWTNQNTMSSQSTSTPLKEELEKMEQETQQQNLERSKWFVMTVENDFTEIQFYKRGFYVTYDGIQRSICLARISGKTVRLSSQARTTDKNNTQQFGIYAIPCINECCVFIGPYEVNEPLGIEVVKTFLDPRKPSKTRGVWITTNKVDNMKVIEHPLEFMPTVSIPKEAMVTLESGNRTCENTEQSLTLIENDKQDQQLVELPKLCKITPEKETVKSIKPIKICRKDGFYHLSSNNIIQQLKSPIKVSNMIMNKSTTFNKGSIVIKKGCSLLKNTDNTKIKNNSEQSSPTSQPVPNFIPFYEIALQECNQNSSAANMSPVADKANQIKITSVYSQSKMHTKTELLKETKGPSMLILKPEEINKKVLAKSATDNDTDEDIEKFIAQSTIGVAHQDEVLVISESDVEDEKDAIPGKDVWIECCNVDNFGFIRGKMNDDKLLSFEIPGCSYSDFFTKDEAFSKINLAFSTKMNIDDSKQLQWQVIENEEHLKSDILTPACLLENYLSVKLKQQQYKKHRFIKKRSAIRTYARNHLPKAGTTSKETSCDRREETTIMKTQRNEIMEDLEKTSQELENQSTLLLNEAVTKRHDIINSLSVSDNLKAEMSDTLQDIMAINEQL